MSLGMVVRREREIRNFVKTPFYRVLGSCSNSGNMNSTGNGGRWKAAPIISHRFLYKENGFKEKKNAEAAGSEACPDRIPGIGGGKSWRRRKRRKTRRCSITWPSFRTTVPGCSRSARIRRFRIVQELYEKKLVTYPRTDARVLSSAVAKEIRKNISGLRQYSPAARICRRGAGDGKLSRASGRAGMPTISRSRTITRSSLRDRGYPDWSRMSEPLSAKVYEVIVQKVFEHLLSARSLSENQPGHPEWGQERFFCQLPGACRRKAI